MSSPCCGPGRDANRDAACSPAAADWRAAALAVPPADAATRAELAAALIALKGGFFDMGARKAHFPDDFDAPPAR
ncbi:hypothetical protein MASR1M32_24390 [Rhodobacter sp.]